MELPVNTLFAFNLFNIAFVLNPMYFTCIFIQDNTILIVIHNCKLKMLDTISLHLLIGQYTVKVTNFQSTVPIMLMFI